MQEEQEEREKEQEVNRRLYRLERCQEKQEQVLEVLATSVVGGDEQVTKSPVKGKPPDFSEEYVPKNDVKSFVEEKSLSDELVELWEELVEEFLDTVNPEDD